MKLTDFEFPPYWVKLFSEDTCIYLVSLSQEKHLTISAYITKQQLLNATGFYHNIQSPLSIDHLSGIRQIDTNNSDVSLFKKDIVANNISERLLTRKFN